MYKVIHNNNTKSRVLKAGLIFLMQHNILCLGEMKPDKFCGIHSLHGNT